MKFIKYYLIILFLSAVASVKAQQDTTLTQEVEVIKAYKPSISDANKINEMPKLEDAEHQKPSFNYSIFSQPIFNTFSVTSLKAASLAQKPKEDNGYGLVRAGFGNYARPYGELFFNSQRTKNTIFGLHGKHLSSFGKLKLEGEDKVDAPFSDNEAEMFIKHLFRNSILSVNLNIDHDGFNYYGYPSEAIPSTLQDDNSITLLGTKQAFTKGGLDINVINPMAGKNDFTFDFNFNYSYFGTKTSQREHFGNLSAKIKKPLATGAGFLETGVRFVKEDEIYNTNLNTVGKRQQTWLAFHPGYFLGNDIANIKIGFNSWLVSDKDTSLKARVTPNIRVNFAPVKEIINVFAGADGNYVNNHYSKIAYENPFVDPEHDVLNTFEKLHLYGGFDGKFATKTNFKLSVDYTMINDQPLYYLKKAVYPDPNVNPNPSIVYNDFKVMYDDLDLLKFNLEIFHASSEKLNLLISGNYFVYKMEEQKEAWNMPNWDAKLTLGYKITDQLSVSTDLFLIGQRKALIKELKTLPTSSTMAEFINHTFTLDTAIDLNFGANYKITRKFTVFANLNNFGFQKYERWFGYPVQSFNFLAGLSYAF